MSIWILGTWASTTTTQGLHVSHGNIHDYIFWSWPHTMLHHFEACEPEKSAVAGAVWVWIPWRLGHPATIQELGDSRFTISVDQANSISGIPRVSHVLPSSYRKFGIAHSGNSWNTPRNFEIATAMEVTPGQTNRNSPFGFYVRSHVAAPWANSQRHSKLQQRRVWADGEPGKGHRRSVRNVGKKMKR